MTATDAQVKLGITVTRNTYGRRRKADYTATYGTYPKDIWANGATALEARANLTVKITAALDAIIDNHPRFAREDDAVAGGALWAALPAADGGSRWWRIADDAWGGTSDSRPAAEAFTGCIGMTVVPER